MYSPPILQAAGFPAADGWHATVASPHMVEDAGLQPWMKRFTGKTDRQPSDYSIAACDAAMLVAVRDANASTRFKTLQGDVSFDDNGDVKQRIVAVFQVKHDAAHPVDDLVHQYHYIGVAAPEV